MLNLNVNPNEIQLCALEAMRWPLRWNYGNLITTRQGCTVASPHASCYNSSICFIYFKALIVALALSESQSCSYTSRSLLFRVPFVVSAACGRGVRQSSTQPVTAVASSLVDVGREAFEHRFH